TLELALAGWVTATAPDDAGGQCFGTTDPAADRLAHCWRTTSDPPALVVALLHEIGASDLAELTDLTHTVAAHLPALAAGRIEI
ncbi:MAG TPA: mannitol dehydrogenase family protein, partial [Pseudonocardia sp.]|nr:mannitol dehydrogenase family protein [Pseudonocardia sp.]